MSDPRKADEERVLEMLLGGRAPPAEGPPGPCPPVEVLAGLAERRLLPEERPAVERHVLACEECRSLVVTLVGEGAGAAPAGRVVRLPQLWKALSAAAILLSAAATVITIWSQNRDTQERLVAAAASLARERPELFSGFRPLTPEERRNDPRERVRSGAALVLRGPIGKVRDTAPRFDWTPVAGVTGYQLALFDDRSRLWQGPVAAPPFELPTGTPALQPGVVHLWKVTADGPTGDLEAKATFEIATNAEVAALDDAFREIESRAARRLRRLLQAQLALRLGFLELAERSARAYVEGWPEDAVGRETLYQAMARLGRPDADEKREAPR